MPFRTCTVQSTRSASLSDSPVDETFLLYLLQVFEDFSDEYKFPAASIISRLLDKPTMQQLFVQHKGTSVTIEYSS